MKRQTRPFTVEIKGRSRKTTGQNNDWDASALLAEAENTGRPEAASGRAGKAGMHEAEALFTPPTATTPRILPALAASEELDGPEEIEAFILPPLALGETAEKAIPADGSGITYQPELDADRETKSIGPRHVRHRQQWELPLRERWKRHLPIWKR